MARITVEDCLDVVPNRFELIMLAARRARQLHSGVEPMIDNTDDDKPTVLALREIAEGKIDEPLVAGIEKEEKLRRERDALAWVAMEMQSQDGTEGDSSADPA